MYKKNLQLFVLLGSILPLLVGCAYPVSLVNFYKNRSAQPLTYTFADGGNAQYFHLKKTLASSVKSPTDPVTYLFVVGGSDCTSFAIFCRSIFVA